MTPEEKLAYLKDLYGWDELTIKNVLSFAVSHSEKVVRAYHEWLGENFGVTDTDGNMQEPELELSDLNTYYRASEDSDQMPFSDTVAVFFAKHIDIDEEGHPETTPFADVLAEIK